MESNLDRFRFTKATPINPESFVSINVVNEDVGFPLLITANLKGLDLCKWFSENKSQIDHFLNEKGAVLFRGFNVATQDDFVNFIRSLEIKTVSYTNRTSPRYSISENVYTSTTQPSSEIIHFHSENSYTNNPPNFLFFCCVQQASSGGETPLADNRKVLRSLPADLQAKFRHLGVMYKRLVNDKLGLDWKEIFQVQTVEEVEELCVENGIHFNWRDEGLVLTWNSPAIVNHQKTGDEVWFNHAYFFNKYSYSEQLLNVVNSIDDLPFLTFFGDGTDISLEEYDLIKGAYEKSSVEFQWKNGDVLLVDNYLCSHARNSFTGERQILVSII